MGVVRTKFNLDLAPKAVAPHSSLYQNHLEGLLKQIDRFTVIVSDSVGQEWSLRIFSSNMSSGQADLQL